MKSERLSQYFGGVAFKELSPVEVNPGSSNQHEFNGVSELRQILGEPAEKKKYRAEFLYLSDDNDPVSAEGFLTWYDARAKGRIRRGVMRHEYRLYFPSNPVLERAQAGDLLVIARCRDNTLLAIVAERQTTAAQQIMWLFSFRGAPKNFSVRSGLDTDQDEIAFTARLILEKIDITAGGTEESLLAGLIEKFGESFPATRDFSAYARDTLKEDIVLQKDNPDEMLVVWMDHEETLFRTFEKHLVEGKLAKKFDNVDEFLAVSLSVQNRRKSRAGLALENHLEFIFHEYGIKHSRNAILKDRSKPDFLFPGKAEYDDPGFDSLRLTVLGVKSTCKERWRQVLAEASRIEQKHLLTLEPAITTNQTDEMRTNNLQLVLPRELHKTCTDEQQEWLMDVESFTRLVTERQKPGQNR